jgi:hypothetical protein
MAVLEVPMSREPLWSATCKRLKRSANYAPPMIKFRSDALRIKGDATTMHGGLVPEQTVPENCLWRMHIDYLCKP